VNRKEMGVKIFGVSGAIVFTFQAIDRSLFANQSIAKKRTLKFLPYFVLKAAVLCPTVFGYEQSTYKMSVLTAKFYQHLPIIA